jgi:hypothetical protein
MILSIALSMAMAASAFAQTVPADYQLIEITNSDFVNVTLAQIAAKVGTQQQYLSSYVCDGVMRREIR